MNDNTTAPNKDLSFQGDKEVSIIDVEALMLSDAGIIAKEYSSW